MLLMKQPQTPLQRLLALRYQYRQPPSNRGLFFNQKQRENMSVLPDEVKSMITSKTAIIIIVIAAAFIGLVSIAFLDKDNPIEQEAEKVIEAETGIKLDMSPQKLSRRDGPWVPDNYPPEPPKGPNGPAQPPNYLAGPTGATGPTGPNYPPEPPKGANGPAGPMFM